MTTGSPRKISTTPISGICATLPSDSRATAMSVPMTTDSVMAIRAALMVLTMPSPMSPQTASKASFEGSISGPHASIENWLRSIRRRTTT
jgi:hypothetical protein